MKTSPQFGNFDPQRIQILTIVAIGRASLKFAAGLFDKHPAFITLPATFYPGNIDYRKSNELLAQSYYSEIKSSCIDHIGSFDESRYPLQKFTSFFSEYVTAFGRSRKTFFIASYYAFAKMMRLDIDHVQYLVFDPHGMGRAIQCYQDFPHQKLLVLARDPRSNFLSEKARGEGINGLIGTKAYFRLCQRIMARMKPQQSLLLTHEQLHTETPQFLNQLCKFLKVKRTDALEYSSFFGKPFDGSVTVGKSTQGHFSSRPDPKYANEKWKTQLTSFEITFVQRFHRSIMKAFGYKPIDPFQDPRVVFVGALFVPLTKESLEQSRGLKRSLLRLLVNIARIPLIGYTTLSIIQTLYYKLKHLKLSLYSRFKQL